MAEVQALAAVIRVARVDVCGKHGKKGLGPASASSKRERTSHPQEPQLMLSLDSRITLDHRLAQVRSL